MKILKATTFSTLHTNTAKVIDLRQQKEAIEAKYRAAIADSLDAVIDILHDNPGAGMTCGDIANVTGLTTAMIACAMDKRLDIKIEHRPIQRRFVELDDNGKVIPGTEKIEEYERTVYSYRDINAGRRYYD